VLGNKTAPTLIRPMGFPAVLWCIQGIQPYLCLALGRWCAFLTPKGSLSPSTRATQRHVEMWSIIRDYMKRSAALATTDGSALLDPPVEYFLGSPPCLVDERELFARQAFFIVIENGNAPISAIRELHCMAFCVGIPALWGSHLFHSFYSDFFHCCCKYDLQIPSFSSL
jgi:hypothetical protein